MTPRKRLALTTLAISATALLASGVAGALHVPTGLNIAALLVISLTLLIETPLAAMAIAKHEARSR